MASKYPNVAPGEIVPGGFTYPNNAQVVGDDIYIRDINGKEVSGRQVDNGDHITVLDVSYSRQLTLVQYPAGSVVRQGYVKNVPSLIKYYNQGQWHNGSTPEEVLDENGGHLGSLKPYESATPLYKENGMTHVVYETDKGMNTKSGYVRYEGSAPTITTIPTPSTSGAQKIVYGTSGKGRELAAYRIGYGRNSLVLVCAVHGWEDNWPADGIELVKIGNSVIEHFANNVPSDFSLYVIPAANPDGLSEGYTNNGPGRCTIVGGVDINRDFPLGFTPHGISRYWTGDAPLSVPESRNLRDFIQGIKNNTSGEMIVIDLHGWEGAAIGNPEIGQYFRKQFGFGQRSGYGEDRGFLIGWAKSIGAKSALIELPTNTYSHSDVVNGRYAQKVINALSNITNSNVTFDKTYSQAMECIRSILLEIGFSWKVDFNIPIGPINIGNYELTASVGTSSTVSTGNGKVFNFSVTNNKVSLVPSDFPITKYIAIKNHLDSIASKIGYGNISVTINSKLELIIEFEVKAKKTPPMVTDNVYCKITITTNKDSSNKKIYENAYNELLEFSYPSNTRIAVAILIAIIAVFKSHELTPRALTP